MTRERTCEKCGYKDKIRRTINNTELCSVCSKFAPIDKKDFKKYIDEKIDWQVLDTFRRYNRQNPQKQGMQEKAKKGILMTRAPLGYAVVEGKLQPNQDSAKVHSLFKIFLEKNFSLNQFAKHHGLSVNGLKKILTNRTYLGEIKFAGQLNKGEHQAIISPEIFYAVQRKLRAICSKNHL